MGSEGWAGLGTIPLLTLARRPSTEFFNTGGISQNSMVGQQRQQISELQFDKFPTPQSFLLWKMRSSDALLCIREVEMVDSLDELKSSRSVSGMTFPNCEMLDAKIASALNKIIPNLHFKKKVNLEEHKAQKLQGRHRFHDL